MGSWEMGRVGVEVGLRTRVPRGVLSILTTPVNLHELSSFLDIYNLALVNKHYLTTMSTTKLTSVAGAQTAARNTFKQEVVQNTVTDTSLSNDDVNNKIESIAGIAILSICAVIGIAAVVVAGMCAVKVVSNIYHLLF